MNDRYEREGDMTSADAALRSIGAQIERAAVVAWLRDCDDEAAEKLAVALWAENKRQRDAGHFVAYPYFALFADAISRGDHLRQETK